LREDRFVAVRSEVTESYIGRTPCRDEICRMSNSQDVLSVYGAQFQRRGMYERIRNSLNSRFLCATLRCKSSAPPRVMIDVNWFHIVVSLPVEMLVWISVSRHVAVMAWHLHTVTTAVVPSVCLYVLVRFGSALPGDGVGVWRDRDFFWFYCLWRIGVDTEVSDERWCSLLSHCTHWKQCVEV